MRFVPFRQKQDDSETDSFPSRPVLVFYGTKRNLASSFFRRRRVPEVVMTVIEEVTPDNPEAEGLILELENHLAALYPVESRHGYSVEKLLEESVVFFVLYVDSVAAGCGGIKLVSGEYGELKRMYVRPAFRGMRLGERMLERLADYARIRGIRTLRLETGSHQQAAIRLYERTGFRQIPPFGDYTDDPLSRCYEKRIE
jgi:GNAT superfamily N-acetyltransferase